MASVEKLFGFRVKNYLNFRRDPLLFLSQTREVADFVELGASTFVVHQPEAIKEILVTHANSFQKGSSASLLSKTIGRGLLTAEGGNHQRQRKMILPAFHKEKMAKYQMTILEETKRFIEAWEEGTVICVSSEMMKLTLGIIMKTMFAKELAIFESDEVVKAVTEIIEKSAGDLFLPFPVPAIIPTSRNRRYLSGKDHLNELADQLIDQTSEGDHLLNLLQKATYSDGSSISKEEVRSQILTMLIAGHETTANVLSWMWYELSINPDIENRLANEWRKTSDGDFKKLKLTEQFLKETLRLYPAAWVLLREAIEPVTLLEHQFKKGSSFLISPYLMHRHPEYFANPDQFDIDRFSSDGKGQVSFSYLPFGAGPRSCIGSQFATYEALLIFSVIGREFRFTMIENHHPVKAEPLISLRIKNGLYMKLHKREQ